MADDIEFHVYPQQGQVTLTCGDEAFARLWRMISDEAGPIPGAPPAVRVILVEKVPPPRPATPWRDRLVLLGCGLLGFVILSVLAVGVGTIADWVR